MVRSDDLAVDEVKLELEMEKTLKELTRPVPGHPHWMQPMGAAAAIAEALSEEGDTQ